MNRRSIIGVGVGAGVLDAAAGVGVGAGWARSAGVDEQRRSAAGRSDRSLIVILLLSPVRTDPAEASFPRITAVRLRDAAVRRRTTRFGLGIRREAQVPWF